MTLRTKKKRRKYRGSRSHGWGKTRAHRKSGMRGGVGQAGRKTHHWIQTVIGIQPPLGKRGFKRPQRIPQVKKVVNISHLEAMVPTLLKEGNAVQKGNLLEINLTELGYEKLLAQGDVNVPLKITIKEASERAIEKIKEAGGKVTINK